jgi:hypothetical protein
MHVVRTEDLTPEHLREFWFIHAVTIDASTGAVTGEEAVWDSKRLVPFVGPESEGTLIKTLYVSVPSLEETDVQPLRDKIVRLGGRLE